MQIKFGKTIDIWKSYHQNYVKLNSNAWEVTATNHKNNLQPFAKENQINQIKTNSEKSSNKFNLKSRTKVSKHIPYDSMLEGLD